MHSKKNPSILENHDKEEEEYDEWGLEEDEWGLKQE